MSAKVSNLRVNLEGSQEAQYRWTIGFEGDKPLMASRTFSTKAEMKQTLIMVLQVIQQDAFDSYDYTNDNEPPLNKSEVVSVVKIVGKHVWQVISKHGWVLQVPGVECPCRKGEAMALYDGAVTVGGREYTVLKMKESPCSCHVYVVEPAKDKAPAKKRKRK